MPYDVMWHAKKRAKVQNPEELSEDHFLAIMSALCKDGNEARITSLNWDVCFPQFSTCLESKMTVVTVYKI